MKPILLLILMEVLAAMPGRSQETTGVASVVRIHGSARCAIGTNVWRTLQPGDRLSPGITVQTDAEPGTYVDLALVTDTRPDPAHALGGSAIAGPSTSPPDGVRLWNDSRLNLSKLDFTQTGMGVVADIRLALEKGRLTGLVKKRTAPSGFAVACPEGTAWLREDVYDLSTDGGIKAAAVPLIWYDANRETRQTLAAGEAVDAHTGKVTALSVADKLDLAKVASQLAATPDGTQLMVAADRTEKPVTPTHPPHPTHPTHP